QRDQGGPCQEPADRDTPDQAGGHVMRRFFRFLGSVWFILPFIALVLTICFWLFGPFIGTADWHPFDGILARAIVVLILWVFVLFLLLIIHLLRGRKDKQLARDIAEAA